jgi:hypothetical protein
MQSGLAQPPGACTYQIMLSTGSEMTWDGESGEARPQQLDPEASLIAPTPDLGGFIAAVVLLEAFKDTII